MLLILYIVAKRISKSNPRRYGEVNAEPQIHWEFENECRGLSSSHLAQHLRSASGSFYHQLEPSSTMRFGPAYVVQYTET